MGQQYHHYHICSTLYLEDLANAVRQGKSVNVINIEREEIKLLLFMNDMIVNIKSKNKLLILVSLANFLCNIKHTFSIVSTESYI